MVRDQKEAAGKIERERSVLVCGKHNEQGQNKLGVEPDALYR
jgi:hypothetical protein